MTFLNRKLIISKNKITKWYSIFLSLLPIISIYSSGIPGLNAGDVFLIIFLLISFRYKNDKKKKIDYIFLCCYCIYILTIPLIISILNMKTLNEVMIRTFRFCFYVFSILRTSQLFFDYKIFRTYVIKVCIIASFFLIVQQIAYNIFNIFFNYFIDLNVVTTKNTYLFESLDLENASQFILKLDETIKIIDDVNLIDLFKTKSISELKEYMDKHYKDWAKKYNLENPRTTLDENMIRLARKKN